MRFKAFTLAEVLLATVIVGAIAGLVLPTTITKFQNRGFDQAFKRNVQAVSDAVNSLIVVENKDFFKTEMYKDTAPSDYEETSGKFLKNYMKVSKYCGSGADKAKCFADKYYKHIENKKEIFEPNYTGACAILKNGASICLTPQIGGLEPKGIIDLNGKKGPNILGRDLRMFSLNPKTRTGIDTTPEGVLVTYAPNLNMGDDAVDEPPTDPCEVDPNGPECCAIRTDVTSRDHPCCKYPPHKYYAKCKPVEVVDSCETNPNGLACCKTEDRMAQITSNADPCCAYKEVWDYAHKGYGGSAAKGSEYCVYCRGNYNFVQGSDWESWYYSLGYYFSHDWRLCIMVNKERMWHKATEECAAKGGTLPTIEQYRRMETYSDTTSWLHGASCYWSSTPAPTSGWHYQHCRYNGKITEPEAPQGEKAMSYCIVP